MNRTRILLAVFVPFALLCAIAVVIGVSSSPEPVTVTVTLTPELPASATLGAAEASGTSPLTLSVPPGTHPLAVHAGPGCDTRCPGPTCDACCATSNAPVEVTEGDQQVDLELVVPNHDDTVDVRLSGAAIPERGLRVRSRSARRAARIASDHFRLERIKGGVIEVDVIWGGCTSAARDCTSTGTCPPGCVSLVREVPLTCDGTAHDITLDLKGADFQGAPTPPNRTIDLSAIDPDGTLPDPSSAEQVTDLVPMARPRLARGAQMLQTLRGWQEGADDDLAACLREPAQVIESVVPRIERAQVKLAGLIQRKQNNLESGRELLLMIDRFLSEGQEALEVARRECSVE